MSKTKIRKQKEKIEILPENFYEKIFDLEFTINTDFSKESLNELISLYAVS